jgi:hypothetical protein
LFGRGATFFVDKLSFAVLFYPFNNQRANVARTGEPLMTASPLTAIHLHQNAIHLKTSMSRNYRPGSYLMEQTERGDLRAAEAMVAAYLSARAGLHLCY